MKTAGLIGGIGPESTIDYRSIFSVYRERRPDGTAPSILINSIDLNRVVDLISAGNLGGMADYLAGELERLAAAARASPR